MNYSIGFIGAGNMGLPLIKGAVKAFGTNKVIFRCAHDDKNKRISNELGVAFATTIPELTKQVEILVLAVKPQYYSDVLPQIKEGCPDNLILISLAPGITLTYLKDYFEGAVRVVRAMPNTPAMVNEGVTGLCYSDDDFSSNEKDKVESLFQKVGTVSIVPEHLMDAVIVASGSSPAFVYLFMEALADSAVKYGIPRAQAYEMVAQTVVGAGKMLLETKEHPGKLKDAVCSPGGTTIAGVAALEEFGFRNAILKAGDACYEKAMQMKK